MALSAVPALAAGTQAEDIFKQFRTCQSVSLVYGTVACVKTTGTDADVTDPDNAAAGPVVGLVLTQGSVTAGVFSAPALNDPLTIQRFGKGVGLLATSQTITRGDALGVVASTGGKLGTFKPGQGMKFVGFAAQSVTTSGTSKYIEVDLNCNPRSSSVIGVSGFASTAIGAATKYLSAPGTTTASASAVPLFVVPPGGGYVRNLVASATTAPGGTDTGAYSVYINPYASGAYGGFAISALTCTITGTAVTAHDITHAVAVNEGDLLAIGVVSSAGTLAGQYATFQFTQSP